MLECIELQHETNCVRIDDSLPSEAEFCSDCSREERQMVSGNSPWMSETGALPLLLFQTRIGRNRRCFSRRFESPR